MDVNFWHFVVIEYHFKSKALQIPDCLHEELLLWRAVRPCINRFEHLFLARYFYDSSDWVHWVQNIDTIILRIPYHCLSIIHYPWEHVVCTWWCSIIDILILLQLGIHRDFCRGLQILWSSVCLDRLCKHRDNHFFIYPKNNYWI